MNALLGFDTGDNNMPAGAPTLKIGQTFYCGKGKRRQTYRLLEAQPFLITAQLVHSGNFDSRQHWYSLKDFEEEVGLKIDPSGITTPPEDPEIHIGDTFQFGRHTYRLENIEPDTFGYKIAAVTADANEFPHTWGTVELAAFGRMIGRRLILQ